MLSARTRAAERSAASATAADGAGAGCDAPPEGWLQAAIPAAASITAVKSAHERGGHERTLG